MKYSNDVWSQVLGTKDIYMDPIHEIPDTVNGIHGNEKIFNSLVGIKTGSFYNKHLIDYVAQISMFENLSLDPDEKDWHKKFGDMDDEDLSVINRYKHRDLWNYRISLFENGFITVKDKEKKPKEFTDYGLPTDQNSFINRLPLTLSDKSKVIDILNMHSMEDASDYCYCEDSSLYSILLYLKEIYTEGHLLNDLYSFKCDAVGKGEVLMAFLFRDSTINGVTASFDLSLVDSEEGVEIKAPVPGASFRIGVQGSIGSSFFFSHILNARRTLEILFKQHGEDWFKDTTSSHFFELSKQFLTKGDWKKERALSSAIDYAEINASRLNLFKLWFFLTHVEMYRFMDNDAGVVYDPVFDEFMPRWGNPTSRIETLTAFTFLRYVKDPHLFMGDLHNEINGWFKHIGCLVVFNENEKTVNIYEDPDDITVDSISQNGFKVIEKRFKKKINTSLEQAFEEWNNDPEGVSFYERFKEIDSKK